MPHADIVIAGGGIIGSSIALHLIRDGFRGRVVLIERDPSHQFSSSFLAMGGVRQQFMSAVNIGLVQWSVRTWYETTPEVRFQQCGYLFLANDENWSQLQRRHEVERSLGAEVELLTTGEIRRLVPELQLDDIVGGVFGPKDGYVDPRSAFQFFREQAAAAGAEFVADEIAGVETSGGRVHRVVGRRAGPIETNAFVIACGAYSATVARMAGVHLPVTPVRQQLFRAALPRPWTYAFPMTIDPGGVHWRSYAANDIVIAKTKQDEPPGIRFGGDKDRYQTEFFPDLVRRVPEFAGLHYVYGWGGLYEMTPDHNGIISGYPALENLYIACGFSGHGLMMSPATGKLMSELIRTGEFQTIDARVLAADRFERGAFFFDEALI